jgi:hypothetical protein
LNRFKLLCAIFLFVFCILNNNLDAQDKWKSKDFYIEPAISYGRLIGTEEDASNLIHYSGYNVAISFGKQTTGEKDWEKYFNCPDYGVTLKFGTSDFELYQHRFALFGYINGRFLQQEKFGLIYKMGFGLSYWTNVFDEITNPGNIYIGTALNCHIHIELGSYFKVSPNSDITCAIVLSHSSNGAVKLPNRGANGASLQVGYRYHLNGRKEINREFDIKQIFYPKNSFYVNIGPGFLESRKGGVVDTYFASTLQIGYARMFHPKCRYGAGIDLMYSFEIPMMLPEEEREAWKGFNTAAFVSFDILYNRFVVHFAFALYTYKNFDYFLPYYERIGVKYQFGKERNHSAGVCMKVHFGSIDYIEWTYGFQFLNWNDKKGKRLR